MKNFLVLLLLLAPHLSSADQMISERSRCFDMESTARNFRAWKKDFHQFLVEIDSFDQNAKVKGLKGALGKVINLTTTFSSEAHVAGPPPGLISDSQSLLFELNSGRLGLNQSETIRLMKNGLFKFEDYMGIMIDGAQNKFPDCNLIPQVKNEVANEEGLDQ